MQIKQRTPRSPLDDRELNKESMARSIAAWRPTGYASAHDRRPTKEDQRSKETGHKSLAGCTPSYGGTP
jgi:hypothetical protein